MSLDAHRVSDTARTPRHRIAASTGGGADSIISSPPTRRMRSDSRHIGSAPTALSLSAPPQASATATTAAPSVPISAQQQRARSKPATQRRTTVATPNTSRSGGTASSATALPPGRAANAGGAAAMGSQQRRSRRGEMAMDGGSLSGEPSAQRTRARKVNSGASSARQVAISSTPPHTSPLGSPAALLSSSAAAQPAGQFSPTAFANTSGGLSSYQTLQRVREMTAAAGRSGGLPNSVGPAPAVGLASGGSRGVVVGGEVASPLTTSPPAYRSGVSASCTLPPMLSQSRTPQSSSAGDVTSAAPSGRLSCSVPQLLTQHTPSDREAEGCAPHHIPLLTRFTQLLHPPTYSPVETYTPPPMPPITALPQPAPCFLGPAISLRSSSTLTDSAVTPRGGGGYLTWSASESLSDEMSTQPSQTQLQQHQQHRQQQRSLKSLSTSKEATRTNSPPRMSSRNTAAPSITVGAASSTAAATTTTFVSQHRSGISEVPSLAFTEQQPHTPALVAAQASRSHVAPQRVLTGSSSASFGSSPAGSPTGMSGTVQRTPPSSQSQAQHFGRDAPTLAQQQLPQQHAHKAASPTVAIPRSMHAAATVSPNPMRPPRTTAATSRHVSVSAERRPLLAGPSPAGTTSAVRTPSKSPTGTLSTEAARRATKDRRRRELYAWNELLRQKNEAGVQDAV